MFGVWGVILNEIKFKDKIKTYTGLKYTKVFEIKIEYEMNGESETIMLHSKLDPKDFLKEFQGKITY